MILRSCGSSKTEKETTNISDSYTVANAQISIESQLKDPESAKFKNMRVSIINPKVVCGEVNSKNSFGGYTGFQKFVSVGEAVLFVDGSDSDVTKKYKEFCD